ncbi:TPA: hypothetical protein ACS48Q_002809 [Staphylococcus aureus]
MQVGVGPQQREIGSPIPTDNASWGGATTERNRITNSNRQCKLAGPQHREIGSPIPTDNASWRGPNIEKLDHQFQQTMQVGVGPNTEAGEKSAYKNVQVGGAPT